MGIFRRRTAARTAAAQSEGITRFWAWWEAEGARATAVAIGDSTAEQMVPELSRRVAAVHPQLGWELAPGRESAHVLVVSAEGQAELRGVARRWRRAAPEADAVWSYSDAKLPSADPDEVTLEVQGAEIDVASATAGARVTGAAVDVAVHHPAFAGLDERQRAHATFLLLDLVLGEAAVETWIGEISATADRPIDAIPLASLGAVVDELAGRFTDEQGRPVWTSLAGIAPDGTPVKAGAQVPLRPALAPHLDTYVGVVVPFTDEAPLPAFQAHLTERLGGSGRVVAHQTQGPLHVLHVYVDSTTPAVEQVRAAVAGWDQGRVRVEVTPDAAWERVRHLRP